MKKKKIKVKSIIKYAMIAILFMIITIVLMINTNTKNISKQPIILAKTPIYALDSTGAISAQQGNLIIYVESNLEVDTSITNRNTFGIGETIVFVTQFNKNIKEAKDCKLSFKFGDGDEKIISPETIGENKNEITFKYTIKSTDNGTLSLTALSGKVVDTDNIELPIGLPSNGEVIISPNIIIADTIKPEVLISESNITQNGSRLEVSIVTNEKIYIKHENKLAEVSENNQLLLPYVGFKDLNAKVIKGKNKINNYKVTHGNEKTTITFNYEINGGDEGTPVVYLIDICDIGGNTANLKFENTSIIINATEKTPDVRETEVNINKLTIDHKDKEKLYLLEGDKIIVKVTFNEKVYNAAHYKQITNATILEKIDELTLENAKPIKIKIGNNTKDARPTEISSDGKIVTYTYTVAKGDDGQYQGYALPKSVIVDDVGRELQAKDIIASGDVTVIWPTKDENNENETTQIDVSKVIIDAKAPTIEKIEPSDTGINKANEFWQGTITFSEPVTGNSASGYFSESTSKTQNANIQSSTLSNTREYKLTITEGDNGNVCIKADKGSFKDEAGNEIEEIVVEEKNQYADTEKPAVKITPSIESGSSIIKYNFSISDNSDNWYFERISGGAIIKLKGGIKNELFKEEDISIPSSSSIVDKGYDINGNLAWIEIQAGSDGVQSLIVKANSFEDIAGNTNNRVESNQAIMDREKPTIDTIKLTPDTWTNQNVMVTVEASDKVSGIKEYSYDNGETWVKNKTKEVSENTTLKIKVKDNADNISNTEEIVINKIDRTKPTLSSTASDEKINITASDDESGIATCTVNEENITLNNGKATYTAKTNGKYKVIVKDNAGNTEEKIVEITSIDNIKPEITNVKIQPESWTNKNITVTVTATDEGSGVKDYSYNNQEWTTSNIIEIIQNQTLNIRVRDNKGNIATKDVKITNIDKSGPKITANQVNEQLNINIQDDESGLAAVKIDEVEEQITRGQKTYSSTITETQNESSTVTISATDLAGNTTVQKVTLIKESVSIEVIENEYITVVSDIDVYEENSGKKYIVLLKEMTTSELKENLKSEDGTIKITKTNYADKTDTNLTTGELVFAESESGKKSDIYTIILKGDVNNDGKVNINDMFQINKARLGNVEFNTIQKMAGDVNEDAVIDINDLFQINKYRLGRIDNF